jgi:hypothetical protein
MPFDKVRCPECDGVLRLASPPTPGKKIKCPKCGAKFELGDEEPAPAAKSKSKSGSSGASKKKDAGNGKITGGKSDKPAKKGVKPAGKGGGDEDEGGHTYGVIKEEEDEEGKKPKISYAPDTTVKDMRGPAQALVMGPTNMLMLVGALGFFGWMALLILILIPLLFPVDLPEGKKGDLVKVLTFSGGLGSVISGGPSEEEKKEEVVDPPYLLFFGLNLGAMGLYSSVMVILLLAPIPLMMLYSGVIIMGAVKAQNLESRQMGINSSILVMLPFNSGGLITVVVVAIGFVARMVMDGDFISWLLTGILLLAGVGVGVWGLTVFNNEAVIAGFEYTPE